MITLAELLGRELVTESGERLGRIYDVRVARGADSLPVLGLLVGARGWWKRIEGNVDESGADPVPWDAVVRVEAGRVVVRDGAGAAG